MSSAYKNSPQFIAKVKQVAAKLDEVDYFQLLGVPHDVSFDDLRTKYRKLKRVYHPDAVFRAKDPELVEAMDQISKRITEAYLTLRDSRRKERYYDDVSGVHRLDRLRFSAEAEQDVKQKKNQVLPQNAQARNMYLRAKKALQKNDETAALQDLKMANLFEPDNPVILQMLEDLGYVPTDSQSAPAKSDASPEGDPEDS